MQKITIDNTEYRISFRHSRYHDTVRRVRAVQTLLEATDAKDKLSAGSTLLGAAKLLLRGYYRTTVAVLGDGLAHYSPGKSDWKPGPRGGATRCYLWIASDSGRLACVAKGYSECSQEDSFVYATGRAIALQRAIASLKGWKSMGEWKIVHSELVFNTPVETFVAWKKAIPSDPVIAEVE